MAYTRRTHEQRAVLAARAKALRADGATMAEISRAVGVPAPTLSQWAAREGWRVRDLEELGDLEFAHSTPELAVSGHPERRRIELSELDLTDIQPSASSLKAIGELALSRAIRLAELGEARAAREQLLIGQRFLRAAEQVQDSCLSHML